VRNLASFSTSLNFELLAFEIQHNIRTLKQTSTVGMIALCQDQVWWSWVHALLKTVCQSSPTLKIAQQKRAKSSNLNTIEQSAAALLRFQSRGLDKEQRLKCESGQTNAVSQASSDEEEWKIEVMESLKVSHLGWPFRAMRLGGLGPVGTSPW